MIDDLTISSDESFTELDTCFQAIMTKMNNQEILRKTPTPTTFLEETGSTKVRFIKRNEISKTCLMDKFKKIDLGLCVEDPRKNRNAVRIDTISAISCFPFFLVLGKQQSNEKIKMAAIQVVLCTLFWSMLWKQ